MTTETSWQVLRSDIYIRDKGICWVCNTFVTLDDYDLGHIVDRSNGGHDNYDNLAAMHRICNHQKPPHQTLEEALKWKLTAFMPAIQQARGISSRIPEINKPAKIRKVKTSRTYKPKPNVLNRRQERLEELIQRITPGTLCWKQGAPTGGAMWRVLPPPYRPVDMFTLRQTPPNAIPFNGESSVYDTMQVLGGQLEQDVEIHHGIFNIIVTTKNGILEVRHKPNKYANSGDVPTVGMGKHQIPIEEWDTAKKQRITLLEFRANYLNDPRRPIPQI